MLIGIHMVNTKVGFIIYRRISYLLHSKKALINQGFWSNTTPEKKSNRSIDYLFEDLIFVTGQ